jgi:hypothetical protein
MSSSLANFTPSFSSWVAHLSISNPIFENVFHVLDDFITSPSSSFLFLLSFWSASLPDLLFLFCFGMRRSRNAVMLCPVVHQYLIYLDLSKVCYHVVSGWLYEWNS